MQLCSTYGGRILLMLCWLCYTSVLQPLKVGLTISALPLFNSHLTPLPVLIQISLGLLLYLRAKQTFSPGEKQSLNTGYLGPVL